MPHQRPAAAAKWIAVSRSHTYELVLERIEEQIVARNLRVGDRLPAERDLATQLGVSRSSVREAVRILQAQGVVTTAVGTGPQSGTVIAALPAEALTRVLRLHLALASFELAELIDARVTLERSSVGLAARLATQEDLAQLRTLLEQMDDPSVSRDRFNALDADFHVALARASHNRLVSDVTVALRNSLRGPIQQSFGLIDDWDSLRVSLVEDHHAIFEAVENGDADTAAGRIESHIRDFAVTLLAHQRDSAQRDGQRIGLSEIPFRRTDER
jgi:GntR family transcriptional repressor for pyruvate dehydrogenase complex